MSEKKHHIRESRNILEGLFPSECHDALSKNMKLCLKEENKLGVLFLFNARKFDYKFDVEEKDFNELMAILSEESDDHTSIKDVVKTAFESNEGQLVRLEKEKDDFLTTSADTCLSAL
jgi:hypothetical protein